MRLNKLFLSSTVRFAAIYMALFGTSVLILFGFIYWATAGYLERQTKAVIEADAAGLADRFRLNGEAALRQLIAQRVSAVHGQEKVYLLMDRIGKVLTGNLESLPAVAFVPGQWVTIEIDDYDAKEDGEKDRHFALIHTTRLSNARRLLVGQDIHELEEKQGIIIQALGGAFALTVILGLVGGLIISAGMLRRIETINETSRRIMTGDLSRRMPLSGSGDEFDHLAQNLNNMLDQMQTLMDGIRHVSDNIAHDLRGSLTRLRGHIDVWQSQSGSGANSPVVNKIVKEADNLLATFNALLRIARIEAGGRRAGFAEVELKTVILDVVELYEPLMTEKGQSLEVDLPQELTLLGDRDLLFQAFANLLDNTAKYVPAGGKILVALDRVSGGTRVVIADNGGGIPVQARDKVFQRFFRVEENPDVAGSGLGLSLVSAVVKLHDGEIRLGDNHPGLRVEIVFPLRK